MCQTSRRLFEVFGYSCYKHIDLLIPNYLSEDDITACTSAISVRALAFVESIAVLPRRNGKDGAASGKNAAELTKMAERLSMVLQWLFSEIPRGRVRAFEWHHTIPLQKDLTQLLWSRHMQSLRVLRFSHIGRFEVESTVSEGTIEEFSCGFDDAHDNTNSLTCPVLECCARALRHVRLGSDERAFQQVHHKKPYLYIPIGSLYNILSTQTPAFANLRSLHLVGVELRCKMRKSHYAEWKTMCDSHFAFNKLERLVIESCSSSEVLLDYLSLRTRYLGRLREFVFRKESPDRTTLTSLLDFLCSTSRFTLLSILLEHGPLIDVMMFPRSLKNHAETLRQLTWGVRHPLHDDQLDDSFSVLGLQLICLICQRLEELSIDASWDWVPCLWKFFLHALPCLRTLHIQRSPVVLNRPEEWRASLSDEELAQQPDQSRSQPLPIFVQALLNITLREARSRASVGSPLWPKFELLAVGPPIWHDRSRGSRSYARYPRGDARCVDERQSQCFRIQEVYGRYQAEALTQPGVGEEQVTVAELQRMGFRTRCLETSWLASRVSEQLPRQWQRAVGCYESM